MAASEHRARKRGQRRAGPRSFAAGGSVSVGTEGTVLSEALRAADRGDSVAPAGMPFGAWVNGLSVRR